MGFLKRSTQYIRKKKLIKAKQRYDDQLEIFTRSQAEWYELLCRRDIASMNDIAYLINIDKVSLLLALDGYDPKKTLDKFDDIVREKNPLPKMSPITYLDSLESKTLAERADILEFATLYWIGELDRDDINSLTHELKNTTMLFSDIVGLLTFCDLSGWWKKEGYNKQKLKEKWVRDKQIINRQTFGMRFKNARGIT